MSISAKHLSIINKIMEEKYSLTFQMKGNTKSPIFYFINKEDKSNLFLNIEQSFDIEKNKKEFYSIHTESISAFHALKSFQEEQKLFKDISQIFNDISLFLKVYIKQFNLKYSEFRTNLYQGSILNINSEFEKSVSFWITASFNDNKFLKLSYISIRENKLFFDFEEVSVEEFETKLNSLILAEASKKISNMEPLKKVEGNKLEIRNIFKITHSIKEMVEY